MLTFSLCFYDCAWILGSQNGNVLVTHHRQLTSNCLCLRKLIEDCHLFHNHAWSLLVQKGLCTITTLTHIVVWNVQKALFWPKPPTMHSLPPLVALLGLKNLKVFLGNFVVEYRAHKLCLHEHTCKSCLKGDWPLKTSREANH